LTNTGTVDLTVVDGSDSYTVSSNNSQALTSSSNDITVEDSNSIVIATISYPDSSSCSVTKGKQVSGAKFDLKISMKA